MRTSRRMSGDIPWKILSIEAVLVVLSVLLALGLNSWREGRAHQALAHRAMQAIIDEAEENCQLVQAVLPYHLAVFAGEQEYAGLGRVFLRNDAWSLAQSAGAANHVDYEVAAAVGSVHALQQDHRRLVEAGIQAVYHAATAQDPQVARFPPARDDAWLRGYTRRNNPACWMRRATRSACLHSWSGRTWSNHSEDDMISRRCV